jgi:hypothetical protein
MPDLSRIRRQLDGCSLVPEQPLDKSLTTTPAKAVSGGDPMAVLGIDRRS